MKKLALASAISIALSTPTISFANSDAAPSAKAPEAPTTVMEKCYGVAKAGMNDCSAGSHACSGHSTVDGAGDEWINVPKGLCAKLVGGSLMKKL